MTNASGENAVAGVGREAHCLGSLPVMSDEATTAARSDSELHERCNRRVPVQG
jgi:hypothetical protein